MVSYIFFSFPKPLTERVPIPDPDTIVKSDRGEHRVIPGPCNIDDIWTVSGLSGKPGRES